MSDAGPGPAPFKRPRWVAPVAILGALFIIIGIVLTVDWSSGDDPPIPITSTTLAPATTTTTESVTGG